MMLSSCGWTVRKVVEGGGAMKVVMTFERFTKLELDSQDANFCHAKIRVSQYNLATNRFISKSWHINICDQNKSKLLET